MEPARRARVAGPVKAVADVTRKTHRLNRRTRVAGDPAAEAARVAGRAAGRVAAKAGESDLNATLTILRFN
ncbi:MAG: hypothetical protein PVG35_08530 [Desulfobacterales bacterium]|jgi:hypothetical protein